MLGVAAVTWQSELSPQARMFYKEALRLKKTADIMKARNVRTLQRLKYLYKQGDFLKLLKQVNDVTKIFLSYKQQQKPLDEKILSLSILKQSGRGYRHLSKMFHLPSRKILNILLAKMLVTCGFNKTFFF